MVAIKTSYWAKPIPTRIFDWSAWDDETYDGAPDSSTRNQIGHGATEAEAISDLQEQLEPNGEWEHLENNPDVPQSYGEGH